MGKVAFVFPGQGAQKVGMGKAAYDASDAARAVFEAADAVLGESLSTMCFEGPSEALQLTANTQPAVLTTSIALLRAFGETPDVTAGHSLGEYSANVCAGTMSFEDAVQLVRKRGTYMQDAVPVGHGAMAAVMRLDREVLEKVCADTSGVVEPVNYNAPGQIVIAGEADAVALAGVAIKEAGGKAIPLSVSAPFHSSLMKPAEDRLRVDLAELPMSDAVRPVYINVDAEPVTSAAVTRDALARQVSRPVRWDQSVRAMIDHGVTLFVEVGPGRVLTGLLARIAKGTASASVQSPDDFDAARAAIAEVRAGV